jgi:hypothetical protein
LKAEVVGLSRKLVATAGPAAGRYKARSPKFFKYKLKVTHRHVKQAGQSHEASGLALAVLVKRNKGVDRNHGFIGNIHSSRASYDR